MIAPLGYVLDLPISGITAFFVQTSFAHRTFLISGCRPYIPILIVVLSTMQLVFSLVALFK